MKLTTISTRIHHLAECPLWNHHQQAIYWTDILEKSIWKYSPAEKRTQLFWDGDMMVGGFAFTPNNNLILCTEKGIYHLSHKDNKPSLKKLFDITMAADERFNDITTDPKGRIFAGTITDRRTDGILYRLEKGREPLAVLKGLKTSNGMAFTNDRKHFFHTDSGTPGIITKYDYDENTGDINNPRIFYQAEKQDGKPDGITIDTDDHIWAACWGGTKVIRLDPNGKIVDTIPTSAKQTSSVMFGGENLDQLFITSAAQGATDLKTGTDQQGNFLGGNVYQTKLKVKGTIPWPANF